MPTREKQRRVVTRAITGWADPVGAISWVTPGYDNGVVSDVSLALYTGGDRDGDFMYPPQAIRLYGPDAIRGLRELCDAALAGIEVDERAAKVKT